MPGMNINIDDSFAHVTYQKNGVSYSKTLSLDSFISSLVSQYGIKLPGVLPAGCRFYAKKGDQHYLYIEIPPVPRYIKYTNHGDKVIFEGIVPMPWALLELIVKDDVNGSFVPIGGRIFALKRPLLSDKDTLYCFPAANVHGNHNICWGNTFRELGGRFTSLLELGKAVDYYFSSEFNTDLHPRLNRYQRYEDMLRAIKGEKTFPLEVLVSADTTFESIVTRL